MANFVIVIDRDSNRRSHYIQKILPRIAPVPDLIISERHQGDLAVAWATGAHAPSSLHHTSTELAVLWGEAILPDTAERQTAAGLQAAWQNPPGQPYDGFYAAFTYSAIAGLRVGGDVLGFFPLYFWTFADGVIVASSPELLRHHPAFTPQFSLSGLIGIMMMRGLMNNCPLWQGVKRLGAGNLLVVPPAGEAIEYEQYRVPCFQADIDKAGYAPLSFAEQIEALTAAVDRAITRHAPAADSQMLLLSGGLDSRTLAGFLHRHGAAPQALTFGRPEDLEFHCAQSVSRSLGWSHHLYDGMAALTQTQTPTEVLHSNLTVLVDWDHLAGGSNSLTNMGWEHLTAVNPNGYPIVTGLAMDRAIGGIYKATSSFKQAMRSECDRGSLLPEEAQRLLLPHASIQDEFAQFMAQADRTYQTYSDVAYQRHWLLSLYHVNRFSLGMVAWHIAFTAWPRIPILDQQVLAVSGQLPGRTTIKRRAQQALVRQCFPELARLPLDRNDFNIEPLSPSPERDRLKPLIKMRQRWWKLQKRCGHDRRYYHRAFNINRPELQALRRQANQHRAKLADVWDLAVLEELLPQQDHIPLGPDPIRETKRYLNLTGILLWAGKNL
jgi:asparagine synthase (glutamine-hydrolysing)